MTFEGSVIDTPDRVTRVFRDEQGRRTTQFIAICNSTLTDNAANARLIAAAPDLLDAAKAFLAKWGEIVPHIANAFVLQHIHGAIYTGPNVAAEVKQLEAAIAKAEA